MEMKDNETHCNLNSKQQDIEEEKDLSNYDGDEPDSGYKENRTYPGLSKNEKIFLHKIQKFYYDDEFYDLKSNFIDALNSGWLNKEKFDDYYEKLRALVKPNELKPALAYIHDRARMILNEKVSALPRNYKYIQEKCGNTKLEKPDPDEIKICKTFFDKMKRKYRDKVFMLKDDYHDRKRRKEGKLWQFNSKLICGNYSLNFMVYLNIKYY
jgi:hypothetical protein